MHLSSQMQVRTITFYLILQVPVCSYLKILYTILKYEYKTEIKVPDATFITTIWKFFFSNQPKYFKILATLSLQGTAFVICGLLLTEAFAVSLLNQTPVNTHQRTPSYFRQITNVSPQAIKVGVDLCPTCIQFTGQAIDMLLNIILRKSTKLANFGIPNLQDFFFRIDSDFFSD